MIKFSNNLRTSLTTDVLETDTQISVASVATFPTLSPGDTLYLTLSNPTNTIFEIVVCTAISGTTLTVTRAQEGTTARDWTTFSNTKVTGRVTAELLRNAIDEIIVSGNDSNFSSIQLTGSTGTIGTLSWDNIHQTLSLDMGNGVTQQMGEELYYPKNTRNMTGVTIPNGTPVMLVGGVGDDSYIAPASADGSISAEYYVGVTTEEIIDGAYGRVTFFGSINDVNTLAYPKGTLLYVDPYNPGGFTSNKPISPHHSILAALVTKQDATTGRLFVRTHVNPESDDISYDNTESGLVASNVKSAIDELNLIKADVSMLSSNIVFYPTTAASDVTGYNRMVTSITDSDYNTTAVDVPTGAITTTNQLVGQLIADANLFVGNPGVLNITTIGNIKKTAGNSQAYAQFYFRVYLRTAAGVETLVAESSHTNAVNPESSVYEEFSATAVFNNGSWLDTDRVVIKYFADLDAGVNPEYAFQFGGVSPVRTLLPVPVSVIPSGAADVILVQTGNFNGILSGTDDDVQTALETIDDHNHDGVYEPADSTILKDADIGNTVLAHDNNLQSFVDTFTLPIADGNANQLVATDGNGSLSFIDAPDTGNTYTVSATAPTNPAAGDKWLYTTNGKEYTYVNDGDSSQWVELGSLLSTSYGVAVSSIDDIPDVDTSTVPPEDGQTLVWNATDSMWEPATISGGSNTLDMGKIAVVGDAVSNQYVLHGFTEANETFDLVFNTSDYIPITLNSTIQYTVDIVARQHFVENGYSAGWTIKGVVENANDVSSDVGNLYEINIASENIDLSVDVLADDTTDTLRVRVVNGPSGAYKWVAYVRTVEVN